MLSVLTKSLGNAVEDGSDDGQQHQCREDQAFAHAGQLDGGDVHIMPVALVFTPKLRFPLQLSWAFIIFSFFHSFSTSTIILSD